jgi:hypothetical protein
MKKNLIKVAGLATLAMLMPLFSQAQGVAEDLHGLQGVLQSCIIKCCRYARA